MKLDKQTIQEIINVSNHNSEKSVLESIDCGAIEVFEDKASYLDEGWTFDNEEQFSVLSSGKVVYFE